MLLSMTGFGEAHRHEDGLAVAVEIRTINSRYFKLALKCTEAYNALEPQIEGVVREQIRRGTVQVTVRMDRAASPDHYKLNTGVLASYRQQLVSLHQDWQISGSVPLEHLLLLPGVVTEAPLDASDAMRDWPAIRVTLEVAMQNLARMREEEGRAMAADLATNRNLISSELRGIAQRAPAVVEIFRQRMHERLGKALEEFKVTLDAADLIKEVSIFAERSDISEEIVRLQSHLEQFDQMIASRESSGRKLEFLTQEMFREANTIGSKANDLVIARHVIEIKAAIERIREMIQNVE